MVPGTAPYETCHLHQCHTYHMGQLVLPKTIYSQSQETLEILGISLFLSMWIPFSNTPHMAL